MENLSLSTPKLNIFALPNQTTLLFWLIVAVVLGALFAGSIGTSPIPIWPLTVALLVLPFRAFLAYPERHFARHDLSPAGDGYTRLQEAIQTNAVHIGLHRTPQLVVSSSKRELPIHTFGTFHQWYIAVGMDKAQALESKLANPAEAATTQAILIHELYHFKTGDYWQLGCVSELMRLTFKVMAWAVLFFLGFGALLLMAKPDVMQLNPSEMVSQMAAPPEVREWLLRRLPSPVAIEAVRQKAAGLDLSRVLTFVGSATLPFVVMGGALWGIYRPKLWRLREFYADAGIVHTQREILPFYSALLPMPLVELRQFSRSLFSQAPARRSPFKKMWDGMKGGWTAIWDGVTGAWQKEERLQNKITQTWGTIQDALMEFHPPKLARMDAVKTPSRVFDDWAGIAFLVGSLTPLLEVLLLTPLTMLLVGGWPMHFPTLAVLVIVSFNFLIPAIAQGRPIFKDTLKIVCLVMGLRLTVILSIIGYLHLQSIRAPEALSQQLEDAIAAIARYAGTAKDLGFEDLKAFVVEAAWVNIAQVLLVLVVSLMGLAAVAFLLRRLFTWYGFPQANPRLMKVARAVIWVTSLFLGLTLLPAITQALLKPNELLKPLTVILAFSGLAVAGFGLARFIRANQRYARRCPRCGGTIEAPYELGKRCPACHERLHPWLLWEYET